MLATLAKIHIFAGLSEPALHYLESKSVPCAPAAGTAVVREGESGNRLFVVLEGQVEVVKQNQAGQPVVLATLGPGEFFGEMCILETLPRAASVVARTEARLASWSSLGFLHLYEQMPKEYAILVLNIARDLSRRLRHLDEVYTARG